MSSALAFSLLALSAHAQNFNVDIGSQADFPTPSDSYGAASGQSGVWNGIHFGFPVDLIDTSGQLTDVEAWPDNSNCQISQDNPLTFSDDEALFDDGHIPCSDPVLTWRVDNLPSGVYTVFSYAVPPDGA